MWKVEGVLGCQYHVNEAKNLPSGEQNLSLWYVYGADASTVLGQISILHESQLARITKGLHGGEVVEVSLDDDESEYPTRLFQKLVLVNRGTEDLK